LNAGLYGVLFPPQHASGDFPYGMLAAMQNGTARVICSPAFFKLRCLAAGRRSCSGNQLALTRRIDHLDRFGDHLCRLYREYHLSAALASADCRSRQML
jgi:hypothetical protein